jgi:hypothetical protein
MGNGKNEKWAMEEMGFPTLPSFGHSCFSLPFSFNILKAMLIRKLVLKSGSKQGRVRARRRKPSSNFISNDAIMILVSLGTVLF